MNIRSRVVLAAATLLAFASHAAAQDLLKLAGEAQTEATQWLDQASTEFQARAKATKAD